MDEDKSQSVSGCGGGVCRVGGSGDGSEEASGTACCRAVAPMPETCCGGSGGCAESPTVEEVTAAVEEANLISEAQPETEEAEVSTEEKPKKRKRFVGLKKRKPGEKRPDRGTKGRGVKALGTEVKTGSGGKKVFRGKSAMAHAVPEYIMTHEPLRRAVREMLPSNYNFEIEKTIHRIQLAGSEVVALQFPEGLLMYSSIIADLLRTFTYCIPQKEAVDAEAACESLEKKAEKEAPKSKKVTIIILGDVTYGACCVDDFSARALGATFLVHYGHSCLVPISMTKGISCLYVFVDIKIDIQHFIDTVKLNFKPDARLALFGTIQFTSSLQVAEAQLKKEFPNVWIPQVRPLSRGEVLGCTSPTFAKEGDDAVEAFVYLADGRFHLESIMIHNPHVAAYKYDPYSKKFTIEKYGVEEMLKLRHDAVTAAKKAKTVGLIMGTLGRQGSPNVVEHLKRTLKAGGRDYVIVLLSEIFPAKLDLFVDIDAWVQVACPRLSIDWGYAFSKPLLNPYEAEVAFGDASWKSVYPMDFYSKAGDKWTVYYDHSSEASA